MPPALESDLLTWKLIESYLQQIHLFICVFSRDDSELKSLFLFYLIIKGLNFLAPV